MGTAIDCTAGDALHMEQSPMLTNEQVFEIYPDAEHSKSWLARKFDCNYSMVAKIQAGAAHKDITDAIEKPSRPSTEEMRSEVSNNPKSRLNEADVRAIYLANSTHRKLAFKYRVSMAAINHFRSKSTWRWLTDQIDKEQRIK